jgi:hypothetical protein
MKIGKTNSADGKFRFLPGAVVFLSLLCACLFAADAEKKLDVPKDPLVLVDNCVAGAKKIKDYTCRVRKQERIDGKLRPEQELGAKLRLEPFSVYFKYDGELYKGREVLYVNGKNDGMLLVYLGDWPAFKRVVKIRPDSNEALKDSLHPLTMAGIHHLVNRMHEQFAAAKAAGTLNSTVDGTEELDGRTTIRLTRVLEDGGKRCWNIDPELWLPVKVATFDKKGDLLETYWYREIKVNVGLDDKAFDPKEIW